MRWLNTGFVEGFIAHTGGTTIKSTDKGLTETGTYIYVTNDYIQKNIEATNEIWLSFDMYVQDTLGVKKVSIGCKNLPHLYDETSSSQVYMFKVVDKNNNTLYDPQVSFDFSDKKKHNIELHIKTGDAGRLDVWFDHKLMFSYRSPSAFAELINPIYVQAQNNAKIYLSSFILQDTRRIGYEKFVKLNIDPATEQNMPQGSTTTYTLSGLSDSSEYSDITGVCAVLQATSRDANINTGTFTLEGADVGTIDVSDSSGRAYEIAHSETNSITGLPFTRDEIEGKTLSFTVNGAE